MRINHLTLFLPFLCIVETSNVIRAFSGLRDHIPIFYKSTERRSEPDVPSMSDEWPSQYFSSDIRFVLDDLIIPSRPVIQRSRSLGSRENKQKFDRTLSKSNTIAIINFPRSPTYIPRSKAMPVIRMIRSYSLKKGRID